MQYSYHIRPSMSRENLLRSFVNNTDRQTRERSKKQQLSSFKFKGHKMQNCRTTTDSYSPSVNMKTLGEVKPMNDNRAGKISPDILSIKQIVKLTEKQARNSYPALNAKVTDIESTLVWPA